MWLVDFQGKRILSYKCVSGESDEEGTLFFQIVLVNAYRESARGGVPVNFFTNGNLL